MYEMKWEACAAKMAAYLQVVYNVVFVFSLVKHLFIINLSTECTFF